MVVVGILPLFRVNEYDLLLYGCSSVALGWLFVVVVVVVASLFWTKAGKRWDRSNMVE